MTQTQHTPEPEGEPDPVELFATAHALLPSLKWAVGMAEEAIMVREAGGDEADTPEIIAMHRGELERARAAISKAEGR